MAAGRHSRGVGYLGREDVLALASARPRDVGLVAAAVRRPQASVFGEDAYPDRNTKAAATLHSLGRNHAFVDGNKRAAGLSAGARYWISGLLLDAPDDPAYDLVIAVAAGDVDVAAVAGTLAQWVRPRSSEERVVGASH
jgi:death on curing protein